MSEVNIWVTCSGLFFEVQMEAMRKYFEQEGIEYHEVSYELDDYSEIVAVSPEFNMDKLEETGYDEHDSDLAYMIYEVGKPEEVGKVEHIYLSDSDDNVAYFTVIVNKEVKVLKGITYNIYHCEEA